MSNLTVELPKLEIVEGKVVADSLDVASAFGKRHDNVVQSIERLNYSKDFTRLNFQVSEYKDASGRLCKKYQMTRDGFVFLVMKFTGLKASKFQEAYIAEFNRMEEELNKRAQLPAPIIQALSQLQQQVLSQTSVNLEASDVRSLVGMVQTTVEEIHSSLGSLEQGINAWLAAVHSQTGRDLSPEE